MVNIEFTGLLVCEFMVYGLISLWFMSLWFMSLWFFQTNKPVKP